MPNSHSALYLSLLILLSVPTAHAVNDQAPHYDRIHLSVRAGDRVDTDTVVAIVYMEHQSTDQAMAAGEVNRGLRWAADQAAAAGVEAAPFRYRTSPVYRKNHIAGWQVHQSLRLESREPGRIGNLLAKLQQKLSIESLNHMLSAQARLQAEEAFVVEALNAFERRAQLIAKSLKRPGYRIVNLNINTESTPRSMARATMALGEARVPAPVVEGGQQRIGVRINGTVELEQKP